MAELTTIEQVLTPEQVDFYNDLVTNGETRRADTYVGAIMRTRELEITIRERRQELLDLKADNERIPGHTVEVEDAKIDMQRGIDKLEAERAQWNKYAKKVEQSDAKFTGFESKGLWGRIAERFKNANPISAFFMVILFPLVVLTEINFSGNKKSPLEAGAAEERGRVLRMQADDQVARELVEVKAKNQNLERENQGLKSEFSAVDQQVKGLSARISEQESKRQQSVFVADAANQNRPSTTAVGAQGNVVTNGVDLGK